MLSSSLVDRLRTLLLWFLKPEKSDILKFRLTLLSFLTVPAHFGLAWVISILVRRPYCRLCR